MKKIPQQLTLSESTRFFGIAHFLTRVLLYWRTKNHVDSERAKQFRLPIGLALTLHVLLLLAFIIEISSSAYRTQASMQQAPVIQAMAISQAQLNDQIQAIKEVRHAKKAADLAHQKQLEEKALAAERVRIQAAENMAKLKAQAKAKQVALAREKQEKAARLQQQKIHEEKQKALLTQQKKLQDQLMRQQLASEQKTLNSVNAQIAEGAVDQYQARILSEIQSHWRIRQVNEKLACIYKVNIAPGGMVLSITLIKSSGDPALDESAKVAILQASPLPVPENPALFDRFRELMLTLSPRGYVS